MLQEIVFVVARDLNGGIGKNNALPWKLRTDLQNFKAITLGHVVVMGRKTAESLDKPLVNRTNLVLSKGGFTKEGFSSYSSIEDILKAYPDQKLFVIGGAQIYKAFLPLATEMVLTELQTKVDVDTWFTWQPDNHWQLLHQSPVIQNEKDDFPFIIKTFKKHEEPAIEHP